MGGSIFNAVVIDAVRRKWVVPDGSARWGSN